MNRLYPKLAPIPTANPRRNGQVCTFTPRGAVLEIVSSRNPLGEIADVHRT